MGWGEALVCKNAIFTISYISYTESGLPGLPLCMGQKMRFLPSHIESGLPGLPLCMGAKNAIFTVSLHKVGFQDSHCAWGQKKQFSPSHYTRWASWTPTVCRHKNSDFTFSLCKVGFQDSHCALGQKRDFHLLITKGGLPGLSLCRGIKNRYVLLSYIQKWASRTPTV